MKRLFFFLCLICTSAGLSAQLDQPLRDFEALSVMGLFEVELFPADEPRMEIYSDEIDPERVKIVQRGGQLKISLLKSLIEDEEIEIKLYYVPGQLREIYASAGADIRCDGLLQTDFLRVRAGSGSQVYLEVELDELDATAAEGGHLGLRGSSAQVDCNANTGGIIDAHRLEAAYVVSRAGTGGEVSIQVNDSLDAKASTGGVIRYRGEAKERNVRTILGGEVNRY
ncbi:MAG: head GIN domain-containing protein [Bacteroidota bacterium]